MEFSPPSFFPKHNKKKACVPQIRLCISSVHVMTNIDFPVRWDRMQDTFRGNYFRERKPRNENNS
jgi:hypothetical protein